jgi:predicted TIM-barrel fold metal-dependent hydrolase
VIIDFHTHVFPDDLAERAVETLMAKANYRLKPWNNGTVAGLVRNMDNWGIDVSVALPVITKQSQMKGLNEWAGSIFSDRLIAFGGVFPHTDDYKRDIDFVAGLGLKGLKFHVEYQDFVVDDEKMFKIYDYALSKDLILIFHAGFDYGFPPPYKSSPKQFARILEAMQGGTIIIAHLGGHGQWDDVMEHLAGKDVYFDTSMGFEYYSNEQFLEIVEIHGAQKLLFASDSPWSSAEKEMEHLMSLPLKETDKAAILGGNAKRILNI